MITETMTNGVYQAYDDDRLLLTITDLGRNTYWAVNSSFSITAEVSPIDDYSNRVRCISHKIRDKQGRYRTSTKLLQHNLSWLDWMLEEKGFVRKKNQRR